MFIAAYVTCVPPGHTARVQGLLETDAVQVKSAQGHLASLVRGGLQNIAGDNELVEFW